MGKGIIRCREKERAMHVERRHTQRPGVRKVVGPGGCSVVNDGRGQKGGGRVGRGPGHRDPGPL